MTDLLEILDELDRLRELAGGCFPWKSLKTSDGEFCVDSVGDAVWFTHGYHRSFVLAVVNHSKAIAEECRRLTAENEELRDDAWEAKLKAADRMAKAIDEMSLFENVLIEMTHDQACVVRDLSDPRRDFGEPFHYEHESL